MTTLRLKVNVALGASAESACQAGVDLANRLGYGVEFEFNTIRCLIMPGADWADEVAYITKGIRDKVKPQTVKKWQWVIKDDAGDCDLSRHYETRSQVVANCPAFDVYERVDASEKDFPAP